MKAQRSIRDCWLAVNLSGLVPGMGQCYGRQWTKGLLVTGVFFGFVSHALWSLLAAEGNTVRAFWLLGMAGLVYLANIWDAFATAGRSRYPLSKRQGKDLWYSVFLSQILPGLGHLYLNQAVAGALFLAVGVGLSLMANQQPVLMPLACTVWSISGYHAYRSVPPNLDENHSRSIQMLTVVIVGGLLLRLGMGSLPGWVDQTVMQCIVPSESMVPTLQINDRIFVSRDGVSAALPNRAIAFPRNHLYQPQTGDIIVFKVPPAAIALVNAQPEDLFVKRVIGLPGQQIEVRDRQVWVNQIPLVESYLNTPTDYQWGPERVPNNAYFVLGDNRNESGDSHVWGFLPEAKIIGKAYKIYWPAERVRSLQH